MASMDVDSGACAPRAAEWARKKLVKLPVTEDPLADSSVVCLLSLRRAQVSRSTDGDLPLTVSVHYAGLEFAMLA